MAEKIERTTSETMTTDEARERLAQGERDAAEQLAHKREQAESDEQPEPAADEDPGDKPNAAPIEPVEQDAPLAAPAPGAPDPDDGAA